MFRINEGLEARYVSGGGEEFIEGAFKVVRITKKFMIIEMIDCGFYAQSPDWKTRKIPLQDFKGRKEPMPEWIDDYTFVCYHKQSGTPTTYTRI